MAMEVTGSYDNYIKAENIGASQKMDAVSKGIQTEITGRQRALKSLSENGEMSAEEKMKKKQEISQEIEELKNELRQRQLEKRREEQEKAKELQQKKKDTAGEPERKREPEAFELPDNSNSMQAMISAVSGMSQAELEGNVAAKMENQAGILRAEIKQDAARGKGTEAKEAKLAKIEERAMKVASSQMTAMKDAKKDIKRAGEYNSEKKDNKKPVYKKPQNNTMKNIPGVEYKQDGKKANKQFFHSSLDIKG